MNGTYEEGEPHQEIQITFRFNVKHSPGTPEHLRQIVESYLRPKGVRLEGITIYL
jgi:hypothetical protein